MCGIVGLFAKTRSVEDSLGKLLSDMLVIMSDRGPDSAGVAVYKKSNGNKIKVTLQSEEPSDDFPKLNSYLSKQKNLKTQLKINSTHAVLELSEKNSNLIINYLKKHFPKIRLMSTGSNIEIYKEVGAPESVVERFNIRKMRGSHGIGHTRMATESDVDIRSAHPYWAFPYNDVSVVHNGQITNYWIMRRQMEKKGHRFTSNCDSELLAVYTAHNLSLGVNLEDSLRKSIEEIDGVFTYLVATKDQLGMAKDTMAAKPLVLYESDELIAMASEEVAIRAILPEEIDTSDPYDEEVRVWQA